MNSFRIQRLLLLIIEKFHFSEDVLKVQETEAINFNLQDTPRHATRKALLDLCTKPIVI